MAGLADDVGLFKEATLSILASGAYADQVRQDEQEGAALGIDGVPFFVVNRKYGISGAQPVEALRDTLQRIHDG